jgi:hypothetical protein
VTQSRRLSPETTYAIPLPSVYRFRGNHRSKEDPISKLTNYLVRTLGYEVADAVFNHCVWREDTDKQFEKLVYRYIRKQNPLMSTKYIKKHLPFMMFDTPVPYNFKWMEPNMLYVRKEDISEKEAKVLGGLKVMKEFDKDLEELLK